MAAIPEEHRAYLLEMRALAKDDDGNEVLIGLTSSETEFYLRYSLGSASHGESERYLQLNEKHEKARFVILGAENELRFDNPSKH